MGKKGCSGVTRVLTIYGVTLTMTLLLSQPSEASFCHQFPWPETGEDHAQVESLLKGREAMEDGLLKEATQQFQTFIREHPQGPNSIGARFALATILATNNNQDEAWVETIGYLQSVRRRYPDSEYSPWALCQIGYLYTRLGWFPEAKGTFEQFLDAYPDHPLTPSGLLGAATNFLNHDQNLEAGLIFRRVLAEPKWHDFHLEAALGLADATAASKAWDQAHYWFETVVLEQPELLRASASSQYRRGLTELALGKTPKAIEQFLTVFNLHPFDENAGRSLNRLAELLAAQGQDVPALWFAHLAMKRFPGQEQGYAGESAILRWAQADLKKGPEAVFDGAVRHRLAELGVALPITWNEFRKRAAAFVMVAGGALADEASFWIAESYEAEGNHDEAMRRAIHLAGTRSGTLWGNRSAEFAKTLLHQYAEQQDWVRLASFFDAYPDLFATLNPGPTLIFDMGEAYRHLQLPEEALEWYDRVLVKHPSASIREEVLARKITVAAKIHNETVMQKAGEQYVQEYPEGQWIIDVSKQLGQLAIKQKNFSAAQAHYGRILAHATDDQIRLATQRQVVRIYQRAGEYDKAIQGSQDLIGNKGATTEDRLLYADVLFDAGRFSEAGEEYNVLRESLDSPDRRLWAQYRLAVSYRAQGKIEDAKKLLTQLTAAQESTDEFDTAIRAAAAAQNMELRLVSTEKSREKNKK